MSTERDAKVQSVSPGAADLPTGLAADLPWLRGPLQQVLTHFKGHATLIHGSPGDGAHDLAMRLAQAWLCEMADDAGHRPCGRCVSCRLFGQGTHPDQNCLLPQAHAQARGMAVDIKEGRKPSKQIRVDEVRQVIDGMVTTSGRGRGKVLVIFPAEAMNAVAASALLKTLEEPPAGTRIVLAAAEPARLLPTILSRCQRFTLRAPDEELSLAWLQQQGLPQAQVLLHAAGGHPLDALAMRHAGITPDAWLSLPTRLAASQTGVLSGWPVPAMLDALGKLCHDAMAHTVGGQPRFFEGANFPQGLSLLTLSNWQRSLSRLQRHAEHPWNEPLLADALAREAQDALQPHRTTAGQTPGQTTSRSSANTPSRSLEQTPLNATPGLHSSP